MYVWSRDSCQCSLGCKKPGGILSPGGFCLPSEAAMVPKFPPCAGTGAVPAFQSFPPVKRNLSKHRCKTEISLPPLLL